MIRLEAFLEDKRAGRVLHALEGLVVQMTMVPVKNATVKGKKVVSAGGPESASNAVQMFVANALNQKVKEVKTSDILSYAETYGFKKAGIMAAIMMLKRTKILKPKKRGVYTIKLKGVNNG